MCDILSSYTFDLAHRRGKENAVADALSRLPLPPTEDDYDPCRLLEGGDPEVYTISISSGEPVRLAPWQYIVPSSRSPYPI